MKRIRIGLIGFGLGGRVFHAPLIKHTNGLDLAKVRTTNPDHQKIVSERYPEVEIVADSDDIINDEEIELVVVAVPHVFHYELAKAALLADKHVIVEKPFTVTTEQADELISLSRIKGKMLSVYQNRRWDADFLTLKEVIEEGKVGRIVEFESHFDRFKNFIRPETWKEEGDLGNGLLYDLGSHLIDQVLVLFGTPNSVTAFIHSQRDNSEIVDNFEVLLHYADMKVTVKSGMLVKEPLPKYILLGDQGAFIKYGLDVQEPELDAAKKSLDDPTWGVEPKEHWGILHYTDGSADYRYHVESKPGNYPAYYQNIYDHLAKNEPLAVTAEQGRNTVRVIELAMQSDLEKRTIDFS